MAVSHEPNPNGIRRYRSTTDSLAASLIGVSESSDRGRFVYIGCYTQGLGGDGEGITRARREPSGELRDATLVATTPSPSFLAKHPAKPILYAVNELDDGLLTAFAMAPDGALTEVGSWSTGGASPCHVSVGSSAGSEYAYVANYGGGSIAVFALDVTGVPTGRTDLVAHSGQGVHQDRQDAPHAHQVIPVDGGVLVVDLGLDAVYRYAVEAESGQLGPAMLIAAPAPGTGPRHLVDGAAAMVHVVGELDPVVVSYEVTAAGWREVSRVPTSTASGLVQPSEIDVSEDGRFLYVANRGVDTVAIFALSTGSPRWVAEVPTGGAWPRHFVAVDDLLYVANERSHSVAALRRDAATGILVQTGGALSTPSPTCVLPI